MTDTTNSNWTKELSATLESLQNENSKTINNNSLEGIIKEFADTIGSYVSVEEKGQISSQINNILSQVENLKQQTFQMGADILKDHYISSISGELHSVISQTEKSVEGILDIADAIRNINGADVSDNLKKNLSTHSTKLLELCNFQDLTGQIIQRIVKRLTTIETTIGNISHIIQQDPRVIITTEVTPPTANKTDPAKLLNGPQNEEDRPSQSEVDDLFNSI